MASTLCSLSKMATAEDPIVMNESETSSDGYNNIKKKIVDEQFR